MDHIRWQASDMQAKAREVLSLLTEDFYSPWEIAIQVPVGRDELRLIIQRLLADGLAEWYLRDHDTAPATAWPDQTPPPDLDADQTWRAADLAEPQILLGITDRGKESYYRT